MMLLHDIRYAARTIRRDIAFSTVAVLIIAIGIGANAAIFSLVNALLLRPLPFPDADRLVWIENNGGGAAAGRGAGPPSLSARTTRALTFREWRAQNRSFDEVAAYFAFYNYESARLTSGSESERLVDVAVTCSFYSTLGIEPAIGRLFVEEECQGNGPRAVLISHSLWERRFNSDRSIAGRAITLNDGPVTVVGVMPASFDFGAVFAPGTRADVWSVFPVDDVHDRWGNTLSIVGRLRPGVTLEMAQADLDGITRELQRTRPDRGRFYGARVTPLHEHVSGRLRVGLLVLFGAVAAVLLIVCANLSNLLLARAASRGQEIAVRTALGASRFRLVRQLLTESLMLALLGATLGVLLAVVITRGITSLRTFNLPLLQSVQVDGAALAFAVVLAVLTGIVFGLVPALQVSGTRPQDSLQQSVRGSSGGTRTAWMRRGLVVAEIALACTLLVTAGLLVRSFARVLDVDPGFRPEHVAVLRIETSPALRSVIERSAFYQEVVRRVEAVPGIESAALTDALPLDRNRTFRLTVQGETYAPGQAPIVFVRVISDGYFETMGIPILAGTDFTGRETPEAQGVMIVNETAARQLFGGRDPLDRIVTANALDYRVIGIVGDVRHTSLEEESGSEIYLPITRIGPAGSADLVMRTTLAPAAAAASIRAALRPLDPTLPTADIRLMQQLVDRALSPRRFIMWLLSAFAAQALLLACLGIYGVVSYSVTERTKEIGIRMALGASKGDVERRVMGEILVLAGCGAVLGLFGAFAAGQAVAALLYGMSATDPVTYVQMLAILISIAIVAGYLPARRAARVDPMTALRSS